MMISQQRRWATQAFLEVSELKKEDSQDRDKFRTLCMIAPGIIQQSGLAQGLIFLWSRNDSDTCYTTTGKRFINTICKIYNCNDEESLIDEALSTEDLRRYLKLTTDISDILGWLRRFAQIELPPPQRENSETSSTPQAD